MRSWLEWLAESTNEKSSAMGRWYLGQLANGCRLEDAAFPDLQIQESADGTSVAAGLVVFQQPEMELYQRLVETERLKQLWGKLFQPDLYEHDPEKLGNFGRLGGRFKAESWTAESFLKNDGANWRWHIFTGK